MQVGSGERYNQHGLLGEKIFQDLFFFHFFLQYGYSQQMFITQLRSHAGALALNQTEAIHAELQTICI